MNATIFFVSWIVLIIARKAYYDKKYHFNELKSSVYADKLLGGFEETAELYTKIRASIVMNLFFVLAWATTLTLYLAYKGHYVWTFIVFFLACGAYIAFERAIRTKKEFLKDLQEIREKCDMLPDEVKDYIRDNMNQNESDNNDSNSEE